MTSREVKNHPLYQIFLMSLGAENAEKAVREAVTAQEKANQATTEFSKDQKKITIPQSMNKRQASQELERQWNDEETLIDISRSFDDWNWKDVLVAVKKAATEHFGWIQGKAIQTFFGTQRPKDIQVVVDIVDGKKITESCFYGRFEVSAWEDCDVDVGAGSISAEVKKRYSKDVETFYDLIQHYLDTDSIYRAKAITVTRQEDPWGNISLDFEVFELHVSDKIVLNSTTEGTVQNLVIDDLGAEGKRCFLFSGGYGNAKTETAMRVGGEGMKKGMAFFYCKDANVFHMLLKQAVNYQPCIVFLEDVDEIGSGDTRDADMNRILNTLDGVQTKGNNLTVMFTTNHVKRINPALRRPGRIDLVLQFRNPDEEARATIFELFLEDLNVSMNKTKKTKLDYKALSVRCGDVPGAVVAEIAKRARKICMKKEECTGFIVEVAIDSMQDHLSLMNEPLESKREGKMAIIVNAGDISMLEGEEKIEKELGVTLS